MSTGKRSTGKPEVIQQWQDMDSDCGSFERNRLDKQIQEICVTHPAGVPDSMKNANKDIKIKASHVAYLVNQYIIPKHMAETALLQGHGDLSAAIEILTFNSTMPTYC
ncbi:hypothetical protein MYAM1_001606 [Malassezia yamatoensis]|uniref:Nascent polypeptide-associated complex subunit alpha-like UBA domain-containing protein n=1 Tax=Malassezia yamatoensis TaxID=253288 RepID=A0AAJ5YTD7_9BASI|nr:hypothetical protein MYAM1_001606 [Malassezia yamatoensis]